MKKLLLIQLTKPVKKLLFILLSLIAAVMSLPAQTIQITGTVTSSVEGEGPVTGVTVVAKGTTVGTLTDAEGKYSLMVPQSATALVFSFVGMRKVELEIGGRTVIDVVMEPDILGLDEVVVTALGISRERKSLGYATQTVTGEDVSTVKSGNFINTLSGKLAGVNIRSNQNLGGLEGYTEWRRLDYPVLNIPPTISNYNQIPKRFTYPINEQTLNAANYASASAAIGGDQLTTKLFWDLF